MSDEIPREWLHPASLKEATGVQRELAKRIVTEDAFGPVRRVAGVDISHNPRDPDRIIHAAVVTLAFPGLAALEAGDATVRSTFPYVPGYLGFREIPSLLEAYRRLIGPPDLIFVDGHGMSHPRRMGIATHFGVVLDRPTVGIAKTILVGRPARPVGPEPGDQVPLLWHDRQIGTVLRTRRRANPIYVSVGHKISLAAAVEWVMKVATGYRFPEPIRQAHAAANALRRAYNDELPGKSATVLG